MAPRSLTVAARSGGYNFVDTPTGPPIIAPSSTLAVAGVCAQGGGMLLESDAEVSGMGRLTNGYSPWHEEGEARCSCGMSYFAATTR